MRIPAPIPTLVAFVIPAIVAGQSNQYDSRIDAYTGLRAPCDGAVQPVLRIQNVGGETMTSCDIDILKNGVVDNTFNWVLATPATTGQFRQPVLPPVNGVQEGDVLEFRILTVNGQPDQGPAENILQVPMTDDKVDAGSYQVRVEVLTDGAPGETSWTLLGANGAVVAQSPAYTLAGERYTTDLALSPDACYTFKVDDAGGDGLGEAREAAYVKLKSLGADVAVASGDFGAQFRNVAQAGTVNGCVPTQLTTTPDPQVSCGAMGLLLNGSSTLHAEEVPGANRYQFRFTNVPGQPAYARNIAGPARSLTLTRWATLPLKRGRTYQVQVRASFDNGATWCAFGPTCNVTISWEAGAQPRMMDAVADAADVVVFPNPSADGRFSLMLEGMDAEEDMQVEVLDALGALVASVQQPMAEGAQLLALPALGPGMYMLRITIGEAVLMERVMVR